MNILFVCKFNSFRSKAAEQFFGKYNNNDKLKAKSAGLVMGYTKHSNIGKAAQKLDIEIKGDPIGLSLQLIDWADLIVLVANDVSSDFFTTIWEVKRFEHWEIADAKEETVDERVSILNEIEERIKHYMKDLQKK